MVCAALRASPGWNEHQVRQYDLAEMNVKPCRGCFACWIATPGVCPQRDEAAEVLKGVIHGDALVFVTPITFGGYSRHLKKGLDRILPILLPFFRNVNGETHHYMRYDFHPHCRFIGIQNRPNEEAAALFTELAHRNALNLLDPGFKVTILDRNQSSEQVTRTVHEMGVQ